MTQNANALTSVTPFFPDEKEHRRQLANWIRNAHEGRQLYLLSASGAVATTIWRKLGEIVSVKDFGAKGDNSATDQTAIANAVAFCVSTGAFLEWPAGSYKSTASIPSFHSVQHLGAGAIIRGSNTFHITPVSGITNTLYVSPTGLSANDGLSSSEPFATIQAAGNAVYNFEDSDATWIVKTLTGTYSEVVTFNHSFPTTQRMRFEGPDVSDGAIPLVTIKSPAGTGTGLFFQNDVRAQVMDIKFSGFSATNASGLTCDGRCDLYTRNVHVSGCYQGIEAASESRLRVQAGVIQDCNLAGISVISNSTFTIGYNATSATVAGNNGPAFLSCVAGVAVQENATGHCDYIYVQNCTTGLEISEKSRIHLLGSVLDTNTTGVRVRSLASVYDNPNTPNTFTGNTDNFVFGGFSLEIDKDLNARPALMNLRDTTTYAVQTTSVTTVATFSFDTGELALRGSGFTLELIGTVVGVAGTKVIRANLGTTAILDTTISAATTAYTAKLEFITRTGAGVPSQKVCTTLLENGMVPRVAVNTAFSISMNAALNLTLSHFVNNNADIHRIQNINLTVIR